MCRTRIAVAIGAGAVLALAGCSSSTSKPSAAPTSQAAAPVATSATPADVPSTSAPATTAAVSTASSTCNLPDKGDVIVREVFPNVPIDAMELGGTDPEHCTWTMDSLRTSQPTGPGYCSEVAWASDNVGYDPNTVPAPPLKKVQEMIGDCG